MVLLVDAGAALVADFDDERGPDSVIADFNLDDAVLRKLERALDQVDHDLLQSYLVTFDQLW